MVKSSPLRLGVLSIFAVAAFLVSAAPTPGDDAASKHLSEYKIKAAYLYYFATYVTWPSDRPSPDPDDLVIGILGEDPFGDLLEETIRGKMVNKQSLTVKRFENIKDARQSAILYISSSEKDNLSYILGALDGAAVLTVGEFDDFASRGGQIGFTTEDKRVRFAINVTAVKRAGLRVSAQLMKLGTLVEGS
jgi:hypothetical protein